MEYKVHGHGQGRTGRSQLQQQTNGQAIFQAPRRRTIPTRKSLGTGNVAAGALHHLPDDGCSYGVRSRVPLNAHPHTQHRSAPEPFHRTPSDVTSQLNKTSNAESSLRAAPPTSPNSSNGTERNVLVSDYRPQNPEMTATIQHTVSNRQACEFRKPPEPP